MNIKDALKETGKARKKSNYAEYATLIKDERIASEREFLVWEGSEDDHVHYTDIMADDWQPYSQNEEIRPSEAGELWAYKKHDYYHTYLDIDDCVQFRGQYYHKLKDYPDMIHGVGSWTRLYPPVNDGEEIVIEGVTWKKAGDQTLIYPAAVTNFEFSDLLDKPRMTMTLTMPKEA